MINVTKAEQDAIRNYWLNKEPDAIIEGADFQTNLQTYIADELEAQRGDGNDVSEDDILTYLIARAFHL